jgi:hypothetical protein
MTCDEHSICQCGGPISCSHQLEVTTDRFCNVRNSHGVDRATMALAHEGSANQCKLHDLPAIAAEKDNNHSREPGLVIPQ